ncbi:MAG: nucleotidyltransferase family protein, partial [Clostridia bacterium]|nr:nucleotidyltransferase family protein [Clostridia bacterium]
MKTVGIIAEYNPLHLGHIKQIEYVKNVLKADKIIV